MFGLPLSTVYMIATIAVCGLCWIAKVLTKDADDVFTAALVILLLSSMTAVVREIVGHPWSLAIHPVQDAPLCVLFLGAYKTTGARWSAALAVLFFIQLCIHAGFWTTAWAAGEIPNHAEHVYITKMNGVFIMVLLTLTAIAGGYVVRHRRAFADLPRMGRMAGLSDAHEPGAK